MFGYKSANEDALQLQRKNEKLQTAFNKTKADLEYIAMMTGVELEQEENDDGNK